MQAVKQLADLSARGPEESTSSAALTTSIQQPKSAEESQAISSVDIVEPKSESKSGKPLTVEEEWVLVATCAAFLSKSCLGDPVRVKTLPVKMSGGDDEWLLVETAPSASEPTAATELT